MNEEILRELSQEDPSDFHVQMLKDCRALVDMSRKKMGTYYGQWDRNQEVFQGLVKADVVDKQARERKEPEKMVVPIAYAQVLTFVSFCFALYTQRERVFELLGMGEDDHKPAKIGEAFLQRDLSTNCFEAKLFQFLLDISRCSIGVFKCSWVHEKQMMRVTETKPVISMFGMSLGSTTTERMDETTKFLGNRILNVSPFRFFPDTRMPISRFQEGEFVASEDEFSYVALKQLEHEGVVAGIDHVSRMSKRDFDTRGTTRSSDDFVVDQATLSGGSGQSKGTILVTEVQRKLIPSKYTVNGKPLGKEDYPVKYLLWYANDNRVIRCEPLNYLHDEFTYTVSEFTPDQHNLINMSLSDTIDMLQSTVSWFINSHITSVRKVVSNYLIVDPNGVEMSDIKERKPVIRLKASAPGGIDRVVKQLNVSDVTASHLNDVEMLMKLVQVTTGISENLMGQFHQGRRSATEARNVNSGAINRLKMQATIIYRTGLEPLARQMLSNLRDGLDEQTMVRLVGIDPTIESGPNFMKADKADLVGNYDFEIFDGTLPSEKAFTAQALQDVLSALMSKPEVAIALSIDPKAILKEMLELRGVRNPERFNLPPVPPGVQLLPGQNDTEQSGNTGPKGTPNSVQGVEGQSMLSLVGQPTGDGSNGVGANAPAIA